MNNGLLDPWSDASTIAERLAHHDARLVIVIGAVAWCETCQLLRPVFDSSAAQANDDRNVWLWLDLEDHSDFLDDFIPENLPLLIVYQGNRLTHVVLGKVRTSGALADLLAQDGRIEFAHIPDLRSRMMTADWAS